MPSCAVYNCKNSTRNTKDKSFFTFPKDTSVSQKWVQACRREDKINVKYARICSDHFCESDYKRNLKSELLNISDKRRFLKSDVVPTLNLVKSKSDTLNIRAKRLKKRHDKKLVESLICMDDNSNKSSKSSTPIGDSYINDEILSDKEKDETELAKLKMKVTDLENKLSLITQEKNTLIESIENENTNFDKKFNIKFTQLMSKFLTTGQINTILSGEKTSRWSNEDIASAISLRCVSPKAYRYLRDLLKYPLPDLSTLSRWATKLNLNEGFLSDVILILKNRAKNLKVDEKICVISYDEMHLSHLLNYDKKTEKIIGPFKAVQVVFVRGLISKWHQVIYYSFDQQMTPELYKNIIKKLEDIGYLVSDMSGGNMAIWKYFNINETNSCFPNPADESRNIYVFSDVPHLLTACIP